MAFRLHALIVMGLLVSVSPVRPAQAWDAKVHRIVCTLTWDEIPEETRDKARVILNITAREQFAALCAQPDEDIKRHPDTGTWHVMFAPDAGAGFDPARDCTAPKSCVVREIDRAITVLKDDVSTAEKAAALRLLSHLIADIHHPLNLGLAPDRGGAGVTALFRGAPTTLRAIWDHELLADIPEPDAPNGIVRLYGFMFKVGGPREYWIQTTTEDWARESFFLMRTPATGYIGNPGGLAFDDVYVKQNQVVALEQVQKAAVRLSHVLRNVLP